jgi:large subunit ribosomal protein L31
MKENIHPEYKLVKMICSCGNSFETRSTVNKDELNLDVCSSCHPFYTGKQKIMDSAGRVEKFKNRYAAFKR